MKKALMITVLTLVVAALEGQINRFGVPLIRSYTTEITGGSEQNWCITKDNFGNLYFGNNDWGVIRYDGTRWSRIDVRNSPRIYSLESDTTTGTVYVGAAFEFGYIQPGITGKPEYTSLSERLGPVPVNEISNIYNIVVKPDSVLFLGQRFIFVYNSARDTISRLDISEFNVKDALRLVSINDKLIISDNKRGLFELREGRIISLPGGEFFSEKRCTVILPFDETKIIIGTFFDGLYLYDHVSGEIDSSFIDPDLNERLKEVFVYAGTWVSSDRIAIGTTQEEGILVFDRSGRLVQKINNKNSGLQELTIYAMYCDQKNNSELWIASLGYISKAYFNLPLTMFAEGITAGVNSICEFKGDLYLSTDAGVLKSYITNENELSFKEVRDAGMQVFPLSVIRSETEDFILAGSIYGVLKITGDRAVIADDIKVLIREILQSSADPSVIYLGLERGGIRLLRHTDGRFEHINTISGIQGYINGMIEKKGGGLWFVTGDQYSVYSLKFTENDTTLTRYGPEKGIGEVINSIHLIDDQVYVTSYSGILKYDSGEDRFIRDNSITGGISENKNTMGIFPDDQGNFWYSGIDNTSTEMYFRKNGEGYSGYEGILKLLPNVRLMDLMYADGKVYLLKSKYLFVIDKERLIDDPRKVNTSFVKITAGNDSVIMEGSFYTSTGDGKRVAVIQGQSATVPEFSYDMNRISFEWTTPYFTEELLTEYSCRLDGYDTEWSDWEGISFGNTLEAQYFRKEYPDLPFGKYTFRVRSRTLTGLTGNELTYDFVILKPWYATVWAIAFFVLAAIGVIYIIIKSYTRKLKNENIRLEGIIADRTKVVVKQKEELESSIHYASRIQMALLPSQAILNQHLKNYFVLLKPRDIVSGDFYWTTRKDERLYIVASDCTGHGVPGAFMSLLGMSFLDEIIDKEKAMRADQILNELRDHVIESLKQVGDANEAKDGMDIALLVIDYGARRMEFSGAYNPCFRVRRLINGERGNETEKKDDGSMTNGRYILETICASKMPIGISARMHEDFIFHEWMLEDGMSYYMFSDGYLDQFGGPSGKKFGKKNFKKLLLDIQDYPMEKQKELLDKKLQDWMGDTSQIDDILVMGIRT